MLLRHPDKHTDRQAGRQATGGGLKSTITPRNYSFGSVLCGIHAVGKQVPSLENFHVVHPSHARARQFFGTPREEVRGLKALKHVQQREEGLLYAA